MMFFGRRVISTSLKEVPELWRLAPGMIVVTEDELVALGRSDETVFRKLVDIVVQDDLTALSKQYGEP